MLRMWAVVQSIFVSVVRPVVNYLRGATDLRYSRTGDEHEFLESTDSLPTYIETAKTSSATMVQKVYVTYNQVSFPSPPGVTA